MYIQRGGRKAKNEIVPSDYNVSSRHKIELYVAEIKWKQDDTIVGKN